MSRPADVTAWRATERARLLALRSALDTDTRRRQDERITAHLLSALASPAVAAVSIYWPMKGEYDPRILALRLREGGARIALPVVAQRAAPLAFLEWWPGVETRPGVFGLPVPVGTAEITPEVVLAPPVGFDQQGYRLGYGGGYFDRTLAGARPRPLAIGVARELGRIGTIHPQPHDVPMDLIATESGIEAASPPGTLRPLTPGEARQEAEAIRASRRALAAGELAELLNTLLEAERAGAESLRTLVARLPRGSPGAQVLRRVQHDESRNCRVLLDLLGAVDAAPSRGVGSFVEKMRAAGSLAEKLRLLDRGQGWVARRLEAALPRIPDAALWEPLNEMLASHHANIELCRRLMDEPGGTAGDVVA